MRPLFVCKACGFISTRGDAFVRRDGVLFDRQCDDAAQRGQSPFKEWVAEAKARLTTPQGSIGEKEYD